MMVMLLQPLSIPASSGSNEPVPKEFLQQVSGVESILQGPPLPNPLMS